MNRFAGLLIAEAVVLVLSGLCFVVGPALGYTSDPAASVSSCVIGLVLLVLGGVGIGMACHFRGETSSRWFYDWTCVYVVAPIVSLLAIVWWYLAKELPEPSWFWLLCSILSIVLSTVTWIARVIAARDVPVIAQPSDEAAAPHPNPPQATEEVMLIPSDGQIAEKMKYAWGWFQYHADQRLKAFNYYLVIIGILAIAYSTALKEGLPVKDSKHDNVASKQASTSSESRRAWFPIAIMIGFSGCVISGAFLMIEIRNRELVDSGGRALDELEEELDMSIRRDSNMNELRPFLIKALGWCAGALPASRFWYTHTLWLRAVYALVGLCFAAATGYALDFLQRSS
jgi:hypothetical protein